jgi:hypothetical protein
MAPASLRSTRFAERQWSLRLVESTAVAAPTKVLTNSVFFLNITAASQLTGSCQLTKVVVGMNDQTTPQGAIKENPKFVGLEGTLDPSDTACIDKGDADATVTVDFFGGNAAAWECAGHRLSRSEVTAFLPAIPPHTLPFTRLDSCLVRRCDSA